jgi:hypothetical protein
MRTSGSRGAGLTALAYDELPEGSELRREFDGRGGVTITAPAGEVPVAVRRAAVRAGLLPASVASVLCFLVIGGIVLKAARTNDLEPSLRPVAAVALGVLGTGVFLFVWLKYSSMVFYVLQDARRQSSVLHANAGRLLFETAGPMDNSSLEIAVTDIESLHVVHEIRRSARLPCLKLVLRNGSSHLLLAGHHLTELRWASAALSEAMEIPAVTSDEGRLTPRMRIG